MLQSTYAFTRALPGRSYDEVVQRAREVLPSEGFGVITEIDVKATMQKKLGIEVKPYMILGACNPSLAHKALSAEPSIGVLLPCNVDVFEHEDGTVYVQAVNPERLFTLVENPAVAPVAQDVARRLQRVLEKI